MVVHIARDYKEWRASALQPLAHLAITALVLRLCQVPADDDRVRPQRTQPAQHGIQPLRRAVAPTWRQRMLGWALGASGTAVALALIYYVIVGLQAVAGDAAGWVLAAAGLRRFRAGKTSGWDLNADASMKL